MPKVSIKKANFNGGEVSHRLEERDQLAKHDSGCKTALNFYVRADGNAAYRPGLRTVAEAKYPDKKARLIGYWYNDEQAYIIEAGHLYMRFFTDGAPIVDQGAPYEIVTPYEETDVGNIQFVRSADVMYLVCRGYPIKTLTRNGHADWELVDAELTQGPFQRANIVSSRTLTPSGMSGNGITISAQGHTPFTDKCVGRLVSITHGSTTGIALITAYTDGASVTADVKDNFSQTTASSDWRLGQFPSVVCFCQDRLVVGGGDDPNRLWMSKSSDHTNFTLGDADDDALEFPILADDVHDLRWVQASRTAMMCGTNAGEWKVSSGISSDTTITPNAVKVEQHDNVGSDTQAAKRVGGDFLFVDRTQKKLISTRYSFESDGYVTDELSLQSNHITQGGLIDTAWQRVPDRVLWCCRADGALVGFTHAPEHKVGGWHRHETCGKFESVETIPNKGKDDAYFMVSRTCSGTDKRFIELMAPPHDHESTLDDAFYLDGGVSYEGDPETRFTGLDHWIGQSVNILADGGTVSPQVVDEQGGITLGIPASKVHVGKSYRGVLEPLIPDVGSKEGSSMGKRRRIISVAPDVWAGASARVGPSEDRTDPFILNRYFPVQLDEKPKLFNGEKFLNMAGGWTLEPRVVVVKEDDPTPLELRALNIRMKVSDG